MKDRIRLIMESQHMTQQTFAQFIGMSPASLSSIFNGRTNPTLNIVEAIKAKIPNLSTDWLMFGTDPMYKDGQSAPTPLQEHSNSSASDLMIDFDPPAQEQSFVSNNDTNIVRNDMNIGRNATEQPRVVENTVIKYVDKPQRTITEIRVFYDDQTWETFTPKA